ncbi:hypothetical protein [Lactobacillus sp. Sy-1]|uniref:hypothetical protein n=1 Tax=Lactobacillus sp. Sy-1 TaxID=2109645 RepID=UPI001C55BD5F|nr:hypothetical protein [Lactobacillus sp. Sy-1]MBW1605651.1 hypothetical protein [Lactobacillus sp. Sy-1]
MKDSDRKMGIALFEYNRNLKAGLDRGTKYSELLDKMTYTNDLEELFNSIQELIHFQMDTEFVQFPIRYSTADLYLVFMARLLEEHNISSMIQMQMNGTAGNVVQHLTQLEAADSFKFVVDRNRIAYTDVNRGEHIFYLDFDAKQAGFDSNALLNLFVVDLNPTVGPTPIIIAVNTLIAFTKFMGTDYGYEVDYSILDTTNASFHAFRNRNLPSRFIDELFIKASENKYPLMSYQLSGAQLNLDGVQLNIFNNQDEANPNWGLQVVDSGENVSWFQLLLRYDFLKDWYLTNLADLEIDAD